MATQVTEFKSTVEHDPAPPAGVRGSLTAILLVLLCAAMVRVLYHSFLYPCWSGDTAGYLRASYLLTNGYFTDGARTPGYPLLVALARRLYRVPYFDPGAAVIVTGMQSILGVTATGLIYVALVALGVRKRWAIAGAAFFGVLNGVCEFEMFVLSQSLALFGVTLSVALFAVTMARAEQHKPVTLPAIATGLTFSFAVLVRPEILVLCIVLTLMPASLWVFSASRRLGRLRPFGRVALLMSLSAAPLLLAWMTWNYIGIGRFRITTLTSWNMSSSVYNMFDRVGPEDRVIGELLARADVIRNHPDQVPAGERYWMPPAPGQMVQDTYWATFHDIIHRRNLMPLPPPEPNSAFGAWIRSFGSDEARRYTRSSAAAVSFAEIDRDPNDIGDYIGSVSWKLVRHYPAAWLRNGLFDFMREAFRFHFAPPLPGLQREPRAFDGDGAAVRTPALRPFAAGADLIQAPVMTFLFILTLVLAASAPFALLRGTARNSVCDFIAAGIALGVLATFVACCLFACYMPHYGIPHWGAVVICGTYVLDRAARAVADRSA